MKEETAFLLDISLVFNKGPSVSEVNHVEHGSSATWSGSATTAVAAVAVAIFHL